MIPIPTDPPTTVQLKDRSRYVIPTGDWGSAAWWRQASLIAVAYGQLDAYVEQARWAREAEKRHEVWTTLEAGADRLMIAQQFVKDLLVAPVSIGWDLATGAVKTVQALPWLGLLSGLALLAVVLLPMLRRSARG